MIIDNYMISTHKTSSMQIPMYGFTGTPRYITAIVYRKGPPSCNHFEEQPNILTETVFFPLQMEQLWTAWDTLVSNPSRPNSAEKQITKHI